MSLLSKYNLTYESLENEKKIWRTKITEDRSYRADQGANFRGMARAMVSRLTKNGDRTASRN